MKKNVDLGLYYTFVGGGLENSAEDDNSSVTRGISNIINGVYVCI